MRKMLFLFFILSISISSFAELSIKKVVGTWSYAVVTDNGEMKGKLKFVEKEGKLAEEVITEDGNSFPMNKIELKEGDILYFELTPEYDVIKVTVKVEGKKFKGTGSTYQGDFELSGEKQQ